MHISALDINISKMRGSRSSRTSSTSSRQSKKGINIRNVKSFGKYFVLASSFETIQEQDEELETDSQEYVKKQHNSIDGKIGESLIDPNTGSRYYEPDDLDQVIQDDSVSNLHNAPSVQASVSVHKVTAEIEDELLPQLEE